MAFWLFMLAMVLLLPFTLIGFGKCFMNHPPEQINALFGYRTAMSMKNSDTWAFAHKYCGKLWYRTGWILLPASIIPMLFVLGRGMDSAAIAGCVICLVQLIPMTTAIAATEAALRKAFDADGIKR